MATVCVGLSLQSITSLALEEHVQCSVKKWFPTNRGSWCLGTFLEVNAEGSSCLPGKQANKLQGCS